jgi:hypothetical protein
MFEKDFTRKGQHQAAGRQHLAASRQHLAASRQHPAASRQHLAASRQQPAALALARARRQQQALRRTQQALRSTQPARRGEHQLAERVPQHPAPTRSSSCCSKLNLSPMISMRCFIHSRRFFLNMHHQNSRELEFWELSK